jgi:hypothetical protein
MNIQPQIITLIRTQCTDWRFAAENYAALTRVMTRTLAFDGYRFILQCNPSRIRSSAANVDKQAVKERPCFLCHRPVEQKQVSYPPDYHILVNPFPIFPQHLTIPDVRHVAQQIGGRIGDLLALAKDLNSFVLLYNGPAAGASAPDHFHFQAGNKGILPVEMEYETYRHQTLLHEDACGRILSLENYLRKTILFHSADSRWMIRQVERLLGILHTFQPEEEDAKINIVCFYNSQGWHLLIFPRKAHRPSQFYETGDKQILFSPGAVDFGGLLVLPREEDFNKLTNDDVSDMFSQLTLSDDTWLQLKASIQSNNHPYDS